MSGGTGTVTLTGPSVFAIAAMIQNARPGSLGAMAQRWSDLSKISSNVAGEMQTSLNGLMGSWQSSQAQPAFERNVQPLIGTLHAAATSAVNISVLLQEAEADLTYAQSEMAKVIAQAQALTVTASTNLAGNNAALQQLQQEALAIVQKLSDQYDQLGAQMLHGIPTYAGPAGPGSPTSTTSSQNSTVTPVSQIPNVPAASAAASTATASTATPTSSATTPKIPTIGTTVPTSATVPTSTLPGSGGGTTTVPTIPTIPTVSGSTGSTIPLSSFPDTFVPSGSVSLLGGYGGYGGYGSIASAENLAGAELPSSALPSQSTDTSLTSGEPLSTTESTAAASTDAGAMPFFPGMPGGAAGRGAAGRTGGRKLGEGLFDDEPLSDEAGPGGRSVRAGVIEAEEFDAPISAYGARPAESLRRRRTGTSGSDDGLWALPTGLAAPILASDQTHG